MSFNADVADRFSTLARLMELTGEDTFKVLAHAKAARVIGDLVDDLGPIARLPDSAAAKKQLMEIEGVGAKIADKIIEFATTGKMHALEELSAAVPPGLLALMEIPGLGPKTVALLWKQAGVVDVAGLKRVIADGTMASLPRMGEKAVAKIKDALAHTETGQQRLYLGMAMPMAEALAARLRTLPGVEQVAFAGSLRRGKESIGDIDLLVSIGGGSGDGAGSGAGVSAASVIAAFCAMPQVRQVLASGETKSSVRMAVKGDFGRWSAEASASDPGKPLNQASPNQASPNQASPNEKTVQVDLRVISRACWGAALMYFTGSKEHNVRLRERAQQRGLTLNEYGLFPDEQAKDKESTPPQKRGVKPIAGVSEEEVYAALGLRWIAPELREDHGELDAFEVQPRAVLPKTDLNAKDAKRAKRSKINSASKAGKDQLLDVETADAKREGASSTGPVRELAASLITENDIRAELHAHTTASDGRMSVVGLAEEARRRGFHTIAVTDHSKSSAIAGGLSPERLRAHIKAIHAARSQVPGIRILAGSEVDILVDGTLDYDDELLAELDIVVASPHASLSQDTATATKRLLKAIAHPSVRILGHPTGRLVNKRAGLSPNMPEIFAAAKEHKVALEINAHWMRLDLRDTHVHAAIDAGCLLAIDCDVHEREDFDNLRYGVMTGRRGWLTRERCVNAWDEGRLGGWLKRR